MGRLGNQILDVTLCFDLLSHSLHMPLTLVAEMNLLESGSISTACINNEFGVIRISYNPSWSTNKTADRKHVQPTQCAGAA